MLSELLRGGVQVGSAQFCTIHFAMCGLQEDCRWNGVERGFGGAMYTSITEDRCSG